MPSPDQKWVVSNPNRTVNNGVRELWLSRQVLFALIKRDLKSRYRTSIIGFAWAFAKPLMQLAVYALVIGSILGANRSIPNFTIFIFSGLMFWNFFAECIITGSFSILAGAGLVTKISFPREILPIASVLIAVVNLLIQIPILILGYLATHSHPNFSNFFKFFPLFVSLLFLCLAFALLLSAFNVYARDVQPLSELLVMLFMYLCPVIYSWTFVHDAVLKKYSNLDLFRIYELNPLSQIITGIQDFLWGGVRKYSSGELAPEFMGTSTQLLWLGVLGSIAFLVFAYKIFLKLEPNFAREL